MNGELVAELITLTFIGGIGFLIGKEFVQAKIQRNGFEKIFKKNNTTLKDEIVRMLETQTDDWHFNYFSGEDWYLTRITLKNPIDPRIAFKFKETKRPINWTLTIYYKNFEMCELDFFKWENEEKTKITIYGNKEDINQIEQVTYKNILSHLHTFYINFEKQRAKEEQEMKTTTLENRNNIQKEYKEKLKSIINHPDSNVDEQTTKPFQIQTEKQKQYAITTVSIDGEVYYTFFYNYINDTYDVDIKKGEFTSLFASLKNELEGFCIHLSLNKKTIQQKYLSENNSYFERFQKKIEKINGLTKEVENNRDQLDVEEVHLFQITLPNDLKKLMHSYEQVKEKEDVQDDINESLDAIVNKLNELLLKVENRKKREIKLRKEIILKR